MDAREELDRLAVVLDKALGEEVRARIIPYTSDDFYVFAGDRDRHVETAAHAHPDAAVAELRAILRADTDGAVADVLDELAAEMERGPITAEMLRTMAAARRSA